MNRPHIAEGLLAAFATNDRINHFLVENLNRDIWRQPQPGAKGRNIAEIFAHVHNVRLMWLKGTGWRGEMPQKLEGRTFGQDDVVTALKDSHAAIHSLLSESFASHGQIKRFKPDACGFLAYLLTHEGHHRGQVAMLARQLGHPLQQDIMYGLWEWAQR